MGLHTVLVSANTIRISSSSLTLAANLTYILTLSRIQIGNSQRIKGVDHAFESIHNIKEGLPELWEDMEKLKSVTYSRKVAIETSVRA